ncbi:MAG: ferredoxin [Acidimicrobiaceae bacterium]|nr:ferredoxin [Acidimicrobiaceae bacterium]
MTLSINPIACDGYGMCAELLPELIELDEWGFPIIKTKEIPASLIEHARRAERLCPTLAIIINKK